MRVLDIATLAQWVEAAPVDDSAQVGPDVVIDTRKVTPGALYIALPGARVDGHDFTQAAQDAGAAAVLTTRSTDAQVPHLIVDDGRAGLSRLARHVVATERERGMLTIALTGSSGKTSTKDMLAQILETFGPTVAPVGSFNNEIGAPLTACRSNEDTSFLVSEMGARGLGHISWLTSIVPPDVAMVLNVGIAHLGEFGSREVIAQAKGEIVGALAPDGWAVLNAADNLIAGMASRTHGHIAWFSPDADHRRPDAEIEAWAESIHADDLDRHSFTLAARYGGTTWRSPVSLTTMGAHQVANAVAATAAALAALAMNDGTDEQTVIQIAGALSNAVSRSAMRMQLRERADGLVLVEDCYNANPDSMAASLAAMGHVLAARRARDPQTRGVAVLGDMLELGADSARLNAESGRRAAQAGFDVIIAVGDEAESIADGAQTEGAHVIVATVEEAARSLGWTSHDVVLLKASRGLALERVGRDVFAEGEAQA
ncbi:UDP-N-acetylmuramoyl-tripeptide--D-alanyl-D-alanine ligase [Propionibacterium sp. NM47_B9-13]|jgi:UDP-N-acetylmuramoyl-tripeptide--D-alanyl-D-alanine ligase|uniref:UDP-N-acetylmuramoyl-tripeptide--D-alanyl-D-alanine ligase n=3 Tax=Bacillati TaxID=1783272 RepID=A0AAD1KR10_9ACTN|nr:UDP-N-acetylmuramoyl-tripeptide--D-alanyl-D-alanine ligase [Cutibacterium modestum]TGY27591.1 UDP-N-acetylmuramoyl-tripeptide--D-alanyl-D-alanine ligase [Propionibacterium sp. NM47_B9-13]AOH44613.1 UDP-N-acetylmuramyl peptide synthase [Cutibacterium modestum]EFS75175.1 UDP-N-acetylmuramoyl-tripeptide--D-alanyl-D-alanine ligase [Cutibacterium modestum HL037PA2]EFS93160.1 UDP-N-acetylmuramoyl-tripeptide--D-alanyl-D-alanine ligase [Cutibacterium modestum HL044PA1]EFT15766.1 UDP-N-acetylmuramoy